MINVRYLCLLAPRCGVRSPDSPSRSSYVNLVPPRRALSTELHRKLDTTLRRPVQYTFLGPPRVFLSPLSLSAEFSRGPPTHPCSYYQHSRLRSQTISSLSKSSKIHSHFSFLRNLSRWFTDLSTQSSSLSDDNHHSSSSDHPSKGKSS